MFYRDELKLRSDSEGHDSRLGVYRAVDSEELRDRHLMPGVYLQPYHVRGEKELPPVRHYLERGHMEVTRQLPSDGLKKEAKIDQKHPFVKVDVLGAGFWKDVMASPEKVKVYGR